jgi:protein PhnA
MVFRDTEVEVSMSTLPPCPKCNSEYTYEDGVMLICPECAHEWSADASSEAAGDEKVIKEATSCRTATPSP